MQKAIVLFSGGLDSTTCLAYAKSKGFQCYALSFVYGQRHAAELQAANKIAAHFGVEHIITHLPCNQFSGSALTDSNVEVEDFKDDKKIPKTYVPARNTIFLSFALAWSEVLKAPDIFIGVSSVDYSGYPDCRPEYIRAFQILANLATKSGVEDRKIKLHAPLIHLSKAETIQLGLSFGVDYGMTISCYRATEEGLACGKCDSCAIRKRGFLQAKASDPTRYLHAEFSENQRI